VIQVLNEKGGIFFTLFKQYISNPMRIQSRNDDGGREHDHQRGECKKFNQPERLDAM